MKKASFSKTYLPVLFSIAPAFSILFGIFFMLDAAEFKALYLVPFALYPILGIIAFFYICGKDIPAWKKAVLCAVLLLIFLAVTAFFPMC